MYSTMLTHQQAVLSGATVVILELINHFVIDIEGNTHLILETWSKAYSWRGHGPKEMSGREDVLFIKLSHKPLS